MIAPNNHHEPDEPEKAAADQSHPHVEAIMRDLREIRDLARHYLMARRDSVMLQVRHVLLWAIIGVTVGSILLMALLSATVLLLWGIADGLGEAFGHIWLGRIVLGAAILTGMAAVLSALYFIRTRSSHHRTVSRYAYRHHRQRTDFGHDVRGNVSADAAPH